MCFVCFARMVCICLNSQFLNGSLSLLIRVLFKFCPAFYYINVFKYLNDVWLNNILAHLYYVK